MNYTKGGFPVWDEEFDKEHFTPEEIAESNMRVALITELIKARQEQGISQRQLEALSGVKQPQIARMERGDANPQLDTILKVLAPLGKTLAIVPLQPQNYSKAAGFPTVFCLFRYSHSAETLFLWRFLG